jgi:membrane associated rhomboid family serine protease
MNNMIFFNFAECMHHTNSWGHQTFYNICNPEFKLDIPWGTMDWTMAVGGTIMGVILLGIMARLASLMVED